MLPVVGLVLALSALQAGQQPAQSGNPSIRGTVVDASTNRPVADARVTLIEAGLNTRTGPDGRFEFVHVAPRTYTLTVSTIGYIFVRRRVDAVLNTNLDLSVPLAEGTGTYQEAVTVAADVASKPKALGVSSQMELGSAGLAELRGVAADDPIRAIQALPGVATGDDFQAEFSVRGSAFRHVGVVMDGTPTQLLMHTVRSTNDAGSIAMINTDILSRGALFSGPHARPHGDWLGATLEFDVREGSRDRAGVRAAVSGTSASGVFEGPLGGSRRGSWLFSIRKSYIDWLVRKIDPDVTSTIGFSDAQAKFAFDITPRQQVQLFAIAGDAAYRDPDSGFSNGIDNARSRSSMASLSWRIAHSRAVVSQRLSLMSARYENRGRVGQHLADGLSQSLHWRADVTAPLSPSLTFEGGARHELSDASETLRRFATTSNSSVRLVAERAISADPSTSSVWAQLSWRDSRGGVAAGLRAVNRSDVESTALPWLLAERTFGHTTVRGGVGRSVQFVDPLISAITPSVSGPERAASYDVSVEQPLGRGWGVQGAMFYRNERDILRRSGEERLNPLTGARIFESVFPLFSNALEGTSRGADLLLIRRSTTGLTGWVGYTWAHTRYRDGSTGESFDGDFDQRHTLNVFAQQRLSYRFAVSGKLRLGSNFPIVGYFSGTTESMKLAALRNQVRLPFYARLDLRANRTFTFQRSRLTLFAEVMNVLGRENGGQSDGFVVSTTLAAIGYVDRLLPRIPSAGFLFEF
ncbi:MAG TPA: TonB-dependent receptor [Vicinamibacterales bacterium]|nr:TonB-dependent receptor [Vicinamibacterales bacterium]